MIPETLDRLRDSDRAVSPVIGVILMVAITVILAAVIAAFVLGFGADQESAPTATISMEQTTETVDTSDVEVLQIDHDGGDSFTLENVHLRGPGVDADETNIVDGDWTDEEVAAITGELRGGESLIVVGGTNDVFSSDAGEIRLIWEVGGESAELATVDWEGTS